MNINLSFKLNIEVKKKKRQAQNKTCLSTVFITILPVLAKLAMLLIN